MLTIIQTLAHFRFEKLYAALQIEYYWPNMWRDLSKAYIPACIGCQQDKSPIMKPAGPLHSLLNPDQQGDSIMIDFIGPHPHNDGFDCIVTITEYLSSDIHIAPMHIDIPAESFTVQILTFGIVKMAYPWTLLATMTSYLSANFGRCSWNLPASSWRCL